MMRIVVVGASGIVGQHMVRSCPVQVCASFFRKEEAGTDPYLSADLTTPSGLRAVLDLEPDVIVNLAGESRPDAVEKDPAKYESINVALPTRLAFWARAHRKHYVHVSTQGIFSGTDGPYGPESKPAPINAYGRQKAEAERYVSSMSGWTIARLTFVLGLRPHAIGRSNPLEQMFQPGEQRQVRDRFFSPLFATDAAALLWELALAKPRDRIVHLGQPLRVSRYLLARTAAALMGPGRATIHGVSHDDFPGIAPRPYDTTWAEGSSWRTPLLNGLELCAREWAHREAVHAT